MNEHVMNAWIKGYHVLRQTQTLAEYGGFLKRGQVPLGFNRNLSNFG